MEKSDSPSCSCAGFGAVDIDCGERTRYHPAVAVCNCLHRIAFLLGVEEIVRVEGLVDYDLYRIALSLHQQDEGRGQKCSHEISTIFSG